MSCFAFLGTAGFEQLAREVEAEAEVVDEVEDGEGQDRGIRVGHLPEYRGVAREPQGCEGQGELAEGDRARRVDVADRYEDQERAGHEHGGEHQRAWMEDDGVEGDDVEVAGEAEEVVVFGLGIDAAELVAGCQKRQRGEDYASIAGGILRSRAGPRGRRRRSCSQRCCQVAPRRRRERLADPETAGEETVGRVDQERGEHEPQRLYGLALEGGHEHEERTAPLAVYRCTATAFDLNQEGVSGLPASVASST